MGRVQRNICARGLALLVTVSAAAGCRHTVNPRVIEDAELVARVKTALVNDPALGGRPVEVRAVGGVVLLSGRAASEDEVERLLRLVRSVPGVRDVRSDVRVGPLSPAGSSEARGRRAGGEPMDAVGDPRLLAVGGSVSWTAPRSGSLDSGMTVGPLLRFGAGSGLALAVDFNWIAADLFDGSAHAVPLGRLNVRPVMGGADYTVSSDNVSAALSLVGGYSFNSLSVDQLVTGRVLALRADNSLAWRPGVTIWIDVSRRVAINVFAGYLVARPAVTFLENGQVTKRTVRADTVLLSTGIAYKLF